MKTLVELKDVDWKDVKERLNIEDSLRYRRVLLNPKPDCPDCNGTGISKYTYDCGALNCSGHNDIICSCRELQIDCPYKDEHPNVSGNWTTFYTDGEVYVKCWNVDAHSKNPAAKAGDRNGTRVENVVFLIHSFKPTPKRIKVKQGKNYYAEGYEVVCPECGHKARILSTGTKHYCLLCRKYNQKEVLIFSPTEYGEDQYIPKQ